MLSLVRTQDYLEQDISVSSGHASVASIDDAGLVERALDGDRWAQDVLVRRYLHEISRLVAHLLGSKQDADDVVQDTFVAALTGLERLREPSVFRGWLIRIAIYKTRKVIRKRKLLRTLGLYNDDPDATLEALADSRISPEMRENLSAIDSVLDTLSTEVRVAWMLRYVEGYSVRDVARLCQCSLATTKRRIGRANHKIRKLVDEEVFYSGR